MEEWQRYFQNLFDRALHGPSIFTTPVPLPGEAPANLAEYHMHPLIARDVEGFLQAGPQSFTEKDRAAEFQTFGEMGRAMARAGVPLPGPDDPPSANVEDKTSPIYSRAIYQGEARRKGLTDLIERTAPAR